MIKVKDMKQWHLKNILNYAKHLTTNAVSEGLSSKIQLIKASTRGLHSFERYRIRILFYCGKFNRPSADAVLCQRADPLNSTKNRHHQCMIINIISSSKGGGAELLVRELHAIYISRNLNAHAVYLDGSAEGLGKNETVWGVNSRSPVNIFRIRQKLKQLSCGIDHELIVHVHLTWPFLYASLASLGLSNIKLIYTEHGTNNRRRKIPLLWVLERLLYARYARIICISQGVHDALVKWVGPKIAHRLITIPNGSRIYSLADRPTLQGRLPRLVSVGSLSYGKNFATAIRAMAQLRDEFECYTIIGEGPERSRLEQLIKSSQLDGKVHLVGWSDSIEEYLHSADIQLIPSLWEGFGLVAVEGMSTGLPVVASNVDGLREVLDKLNPSVTLINRVDSVDDWVSGIHKAFADLRTHDSISIAQSSRQQAEKFTLDQMAERYLNIYAQALEVKRPEMSAQGLK